MKFNIANPTAGCQKKEKKVTDEDLKRLLVHALNKLQISQEVIGADALGEKTVKDDWKDATCAVCMEYPHNAVLLLCSSHDKGCRPYMCGTSCRSSNCFDQYKKAYTKPQSANSVEKSDQVEQLACPLCRGEVKGRTVVAAARKFLNAKKRSCMQDKCSFVGTYKQLQRHVMAQHPSARPPQVDPVQAEKWKRLEAERDRDDAISAVTSSMPGATIVGDYVVEEGRGRIGSIRFPSRH